MTPRPLALATLAIAALLHVAAAQVTDGCSGGNSAATAANGFFTLHGACFGAMVVADTTSCADVCTSGGLACLDKGVEGQRQTSDCDDLNLAFAASPAAPADMPANPNRNIGHTTCRLFNGGDGWERGSTSTGLPYNSQRTCSEAQSNFGSGIIVMCECDVPPDTTAPTLSGVSAVQASTSTVTATGTTDEAGTVYCAVAASTSAAPTSSDIQSSGQSATVAAAGSFSVTVTGVSTEESKTAYCVGDDAASNLGGTPASSATFDFDLTGPTVSSVAASGNGNGIVTITGSSDEAGTVSCTVDTPGQTKSAASISGASATLASAGAFTVTTSGAYADTDSAYCVGRDSVGNNGAVVETPLNQPPTDISLTGDTVAENAAEGTDVGTLTTTDPDAGDSFTYTIESQSVPDAFAVSGDKLQVGSGTVDFEAGPSVVVTVRSSDGTAFTDKTFTVTVTDVNEAPTDVALSSATVPEHETEGTDVGTLTATDADAGDSFTFSIESQTVTGAFTISGDKLQVGSGAIDFEATPTITVTVRAADSAGLAFDKTLTITVTDVNEAPTDVTVSGDTFTEKSEEGTDVGTLAATDPDAADTSFTYTIESQTVTDAFTISGDKLQVGPAGPSLAKDTVVSVTVVATDAGGLSVSRSVDMTVTKDTANLATLGIITAGLVVVAGFAFAFYKHGAGADGTATDGAGQV